MYPWELMKMIKFKGNQPQASPRGHPSCERTHRRSTPLPISFGQQVQQFGDLNHLAS